MAPTVIASATPGRGLLQALARVVAGGHGVRDAGRDGAATASSSELRSPPPRLMFATAGLDGVLGVTQSMPAMTPEVLPLPLQSSTRTATSLTSLATP